MRFKTLLPTIVLATCLSAGLAAEDGSPRGALNSTMPSWVTLGASARFRAEGVTGDGFDENDGHGQLLQRYRFSVELDATDWMRFFGEVQDSREAGVPLPGAGLKDAADLRQAWVGFGRKDGIWDLKLGRQSLAFGSERVIGAGEWGNVPRVFDAVRLGLHRGADRVDLFSSTVIHPNTEPWNDHRVAGDNLHGIYGSAGSWLKGSKIEPFLLMRTSPSFVGEAGARGHLRSWTYGLRAADAGKSPWGYDVEAVGQNGSIGSADLSAWAFNGQALRRWQEPAWQPVLSAEFNFASGDRNPNDGRVNTFDQLYPTNHGKYGIVDQQGRRNTKNVRAGLRVTPRKNLTLQTDVHSFWLANRYDALYGAGGGVVIPRVPGGAPSVDVGRELDFTTGYKASRHTDLGFQVGRLFPGAFIRAQSPGASRTYYTLFAGLTL